MKNIKVSRIPKSKKEEVVHWIGLLNEYVHDTYKSRSKLPEPTVCPKCAAVFQKGRWIWAPRPAKAHEEMCPACHRVQDKYPAGFIHLSGPFFEVHQEEIFNAVHHQEAMAKKEHPLCRIIDIQKQENGVVVTTTDPHLPRRIGEALWHAYHGELDLHYGKDPRIIRMTWKR
jgi:NMD protein affecting ribosome stability and mRNA decay